MSEDERQRLTEKIDVLYAELQRLRFDNLTDRWRSVARICVMLSLLLVVAAAAAAGFAGYELGGKHLDACEESNKILLRKLPR